MENIHEFPTLPPLPLEPCCGEEEEIIIPTEDIIMIYKELKTSLILKNRTIGPLKFLDSFVGKELTRYLIKTKLLTSKEAAKVGQLLLNAGLISHCSSNSLPFSNICWFTFQDVPNLPEVKTPRSPLANPPSPLVPRESGESKNIERAFLHRVNTFSLKQETKEEEIILHGWFEKKVRGGFKKFWFEAEDATEVVSYYLNNPELDQENIKLVGTINLERAEIIVNQKCGKFLVKIIEKGKKSHSIVCKSSEERNLMASQLIKIRETSIEQQKLIDKLRNDNPPEECKRCIVDNTETEQQMQVTPFESQNNFWDIQLEDYSRNERSVREIVGKKTSVLVFLRHFGCLICRQVAGKILALRNQFEDLGVQMIAIGNGTPDMAEQFAREFKFPGAIYCDQKRNLYKAMNCKCGTKFLVNTKGLEKASQAYAEGYRQAENITRNHGVHRQLGGAFAVHPKHGFLFQHTDKYLGDLVNLNQLLNTLTRFCEENPRDNWTSNSIHRQWDEFHNSPVTEKMITGPSAFNYEYGINEVYNPPLAIIDNIMYYKEYFTKIEHTNYICTDPDIGPMAITIEKCQGDRRALVWTKKGIWRRIIPSYEYGSNSQARDYLIKKVFPQKTKELNLIKIEDPAFVVELTYLEKKCFFSNYKFGVLLARPEKCSEDGMYNNLEFSPDFEEFMEFIGTKTKLKGWEKYRGGLDVNCDGTGEYSYYTEFEDGIEIMYHVCPMIPFLENDPSRKRYIGNDVIVIIFKEGKDETFDPAIMHSQFNHIFVVVEKTPNSLPDGKTWYRVQLVTKSDVPPFPPYLPNPPIFEKGPDFHKYLLTKLINGERVTIATAKDFAQKMDRTRDQLLDTLISPLIKKRK